MVAVGSQTINKRSSATAESLSQAMVHKQIKDPINRYAVNRCLTFQNLMDIPGRKRKIFLAQNL